MSDLIDREALLRQIDIDSEGEPGYYGDTWKFIDTIKSMPPAELGTNLAEVGTDAVSREAVKELAYSQIRSMYCGVALKEQRETMLRIADNVIGLLAPVASKQRTGKWIDDGSELGCQCSQCGKTLDEYINCGTEYMTLTEIPKFCPNCGADMRGEQNG